MLSLYKKRCGTVELKSGLLNLPAKLILIYLEGDPPVLKSTYEFERVG